MLNSVTIDYLCICFYFHFTSAQKTDVNTSLSVHQTKGFVSVNVGDNVTLQCFYEGDDSTSYFWFKQTLGQNPRLIATNYVHDRKITFYEEFKDNPRFTLDTGNGKNHLTMKDVQISDTATYYCRNRYSHMFEFFAEGTTVSVEGSGVSVQAVVHQSASETIQPGGSVTLNCTVHTGTCDGEHRVYWFRDSEQSHPGLIYTHGGSSDQCERKPETQTHSCVYNPPMKSLNLSHAGTYYCAVACCGHILFGNRTKLDFGEDVQMRYFWCGALAFTTILSVVLAFSVCMISNRNSCHIPENLCFTASSVNLTNSSRKMRDPTWSECVYYSVKQ
uniref:Ig-like domain-containing protein n=1 Tax=Monopterus albus TaxID=43700 RepID=A0A3Q3ICP7_MONAL